jgi:hypothetical protein
VLRWRCDRLPRLQLPCTRPLKLFHGSQLMVPVATWSVASIDWSVCPEACSSNGVSLVRSLTHAQSPDACIGLQQCPVAVSTWERLACLQVLKGLCDEDWCKVKQLVVEVHSRELLAEVEALVRPHFDRVVVEQGANMHCSQLYLLYATPRCQ